MEYQLQFQSIQVIMKNKFTHLDDNGQPSMVNVGEKQPSKRVAKARSIVVMEEAIINQLLEQGFNNKKGPILQTAILAGVMGAKKTADLIPLCHPLGLDNCQVTIEINDDKEIVIDCEASLISKTGVEMEALTGASIAALTIYDMCKALSHNIIIKETKLMEKTGGKRDFKRTSLENE